MPRHSPFVVETVTATWTGCGSDGGIVVGTTIGKYEVRRVVGAGGAGVVLAAYDAELGRSVAIKFLMRESEDARARLMREAQAMAKLSHPNVITVYEVLRVDERVAIVMELVEGRTLGEWQTEPRTWREIVGVYVQAARGLAAAHRAGLVHRDFKPANALIDDDGVVRVTDFGLVRAADGVVDAAIDDEAGSELTQTGMVLGTPAYMAPEQHAGGVVDARTDQWALACSLYGALYGQRPFAGDKPSEIRASVLVDVPREEPDTHVPKSIRAAIRRALSKDPADRFATMDDLVVAITPRRRAWIAAAIAAGAGALAAGGIAFAAAGGHTETCRGLDEPMRRAWNPARAMMLRERFAAASIPNGDRAVAALDRYEESWIDARVHACDANQRGEESPDLLDRKMSCLDQRLAEVDALAGALTNADRKAADSARTAIANLHPIIDCDDPRDLVPQPTDPAIRAEIARGEEVLARAWAMGELYKFVEAKPVAQEAVRIAEHANWAPLVARAQLQLGRSLSDEHDGAGAVAAFDRAATAGAKARDDKTFAEALGAKVFDVAVTLGKPDDALAMRPYVELALERAGNAPRVRAQCLQSIAHALFAKHRWDDALVAETEAYNIVRALLPRENAAVRSAISTLGIIETRRENLERAQKLLEEELAINVEIHGERHQSVAAAYHNLGVLLIHRRNPVAALASFEHADRINHAIGGGSWVTPIEIGSMQRDLGRWRAAARSFERALASAEKSAPGETIPVAACSVSLGTMLAELGELDRAKPFLERAAAIAGKSPYANEMLAQHARYLLASGKPAEAREALRAARAAKGAPSATIGLVDAELARIPGDWTHARAAYVRALDLAEREPTPSGITAAILGIAESDLALGKPASAVRALEERLAWLVASGAEPIATARIKLVLARALVASGGDRTRAKGLAEAARDAFGKTKQNEAADAARWIASTFGR
jgi:tetratricopeptide (TPR) repeat protein